MELSEVRELLLCYQADSGFFNLLRDVAKKVVGTEDCALCAMTHSATGERPVWKQTKRALDLPARHVYRDKISDGVAACAGDLPAVVLALRDGSLRRVMGASEIAPFGNDYFGFFEALEEKIRSM